MKRLDSIKLNPAFSLFQLVSFWRSVAKKNLAGRGLNQKIKPASGKLKQALFYSSDILGD
jgi:hypothetical protein